MSEFNPKFGRAIVRKTAVAAIIQTLFCQIPAFAISIAGDAPTDASKIATSVPVQVYSNGTDLVIGNGQTENVDSALTLDALILKKGGILDFSSVQNSLGKESLTNLVTAESFTFENGGIVKVNLSGIVGQAQNGEGFIPLLEQDDGKSFIYFGKGLVSGDLAGVQLQDQGGNVLTSGQFQVNYGENNEASLTYGLGATPAVSGSQAQLEVNETGFGLGYQLLEVHINDRQSLELMPGTGVNEGSMVLSALLTSNTDSNTSITVHGSVALNNSKNDFDSEIVVGANSSLTAFDGSLGGNGANGLYAKKVSLESETAGLILNGGTNTVGALETVEGSHITLMDHANLIVKGSSLINGKQFGQRASNITFDGTGSTEAITIAVNSNNPDFSAGVLLKKTNLTMGSDQSLGSSSVHLDGDSSLNYTGPSWISSNVFSGDGTVTFTSTEPFGEFSFKEGTSNFTGTLALSNALINIDEKHPVNGLALANAELNLSNNAKARVRGAHTLKTLTTDNAILDFGLISLVEEDNHGSFSVENLISTGVSTVHLDGYLGIEKNLDNLLNLDDGRLITLIDAKKVKLDAGEHFPFVIDAPNDYTTQIHVIQEGVQGVFYVNLLEDVKSFKGLFIESTLLKLNIDKGYSVVLEPGVGEGGRVFSAGITGQGDIVIEGDIAFNNYRAETDFTGIATVTEGSSLSFNAAFGLGKSNYASQLINYGTINVFDYQYVNRVMSDGTINLAPLNEYKPAFLTLVHAGNNENASVISGNLTGNGIIALRKGQLRITSSNPGVQGEFVLNGEDAKIREAELILEQVDSIGTMSITLGKGDQLTLESVGEEGQATFENPLITSVSDSLVNLRNSDVLITSGQRFSGTYVLENSKLSFGDIKDFANRYGTVGSQDRITTAQLDESSELNLSYDQSWELQSEVFGSGKLILAAGSSANTVGFTEAIANSMSENFYGAVELANATVTLDQTIKTSLTKASLSIGEGSVIVVDSLSNQQNNRIGGLSFNGGTLDAKSVTLTLGGDAPGNMINVSGEKGSGDTAGSHVLDLRGSGQIEISVSEGTLGSVDNSYKAVNSLPLLDQDDGTLLLENKDGVLHTKIIGLYNEDDWQTKSTAENSVDRDALKAFFYQEGKQIPIVPDETATLYEGENNTGSQIGTAYYNFTLSSVNSAQAQASNNKYEAGLYASYGLTQVHINEGKDLVLTATKEVLGGDTLSAKIVDSVENKAGNVVIALGQGDGHVVKLTNSGNSYSGTTSVESSMTLVGASDNAIGNTSALILKTGSNYIQAKDSTQTIGKLIQEAEGSRVFLESGSNLSLREGGVSRSDNALVGEGNLTVMNSTLDVYGSNPNLHSTVGVQGSASVNVYKADALGSSMVHLLENSSQLSFRSVTGRPVVNSGFKGVGTVSLKNSDVEFAGVLDKFVGTIDISDKNSTLYTKTLYSLGVSKIKNSGTLILDLDKDGKWTNSLGRTVGVRTVEGSGEIIKEGSGILTLDENFRSTGVTRVLAGGVNVGTKISPMNAAGSFDVEKDGSLSGFGSVANLTNSGTVYLNEREPRKASANVFTVNENYVGQGGVLVFNAALSSDNDSKQDQLHIKGNATGSSLIRVNNIKGEGASAEEGITLITIDGNSDAQFALENPVLAGAYHYELFSSDGLKRWYLSTKNKIVCSKAGSYIGGVLAAEQMSMRLHDRMGHSVAIEPTTGEILYPAGWVRQLGTHSHFKSGGNTTRMNTSVTQLGSDLIRSKLWDSLKFNGGFFGGGLYSKSKTQSLELSKNKTDGFALGLYGTIYSGADVDEGFYADTWLQYGRYSNQIYGGQNDFEYRSHGFTFSVETGVTIPLAKVGVQGKTRFSMQPQVQVIVNGLKVNQAMDKEGTHYRQLGRNNVSLRMGSRFLLQQENGMTAFAEANWIHNSKKAGVQMETDSIYMDAGKNTGELKVGLEGRLAKNLNGWVSASVRGGGGGYHNESAQVGLKYRF